MDESALAHVRAAIDKLLAAQATLAAANLRLDSLGVARRAQSPHLHALSFDAAHRGGSTALRPVFDATAIPSPVGFATAELEAHFFDFTAGTAAGHAGTPVDEDQQTPTSTLENARRRALRDVNQVYRFLEQQKRRPRAVATGWWPARFE